MMNLRDVHWSVYFFLWVGGLILCGAVIGAFTFPIGGWILGAESTTPALIRRGVRFMSFIFMIWAPAIGITACVMRAYRKRHPDAERPQ